jgi:serine/threonine kinase 32
MAYMAPEVVGKRGYTWHIDWWSLGVTVFELLFHKRPFDGRNAEKMTDSILNDTLDFPADVKSRCSPEGIKALKGVSLHSSSPNLRLISLLVH